MCSGQGDGECTPIPLTNLTCSRLEQALQAARQSPAGASWATDIELADVIAALAAPRLQRVAMDPRQPFPVALCASGGLVVAAGLVTLGFFPSPLSGMVSTPLVVLGLALLVMAGANYALQRRWRRSIVSEVARERRLAIAIWSRHNLTYQRLTLCPNCGEVQDPLTGAHAAWPRAWRLIFEIDPSGKSSES